MLCTGLRKTRIKLKEDKAALIATRISFSCPNIEDWGVGIKDLHVIPENLGGIGSVTLNTHGPDFFLRNAFI